MADNGDRSARDEVLDELRGAEKLIVVTHENPDGDALGSLIAMQEILTTLNRYRKDLIHSQNELSPLRAPGEGVQALIAELNTRHAELTAGLEDVETVGNQTLGARVAGFADNKRMAEQRIAEVHRHFAQLESIRNEIAVAFADLNSAFKKFV